MGVPAHGRAVLRAFLPTMPIRGLIVGLIVGPAVVFPAHAAAPAAASVNIEWVTVGAPGNPPDTEVMASDRTTGFGSVPYAYRLGKYDVTNQEYADFLNAVAQSADPFLLYVPCMDRSQCYGVGSGIVRTGAMGNY